MIKVGVLGAKGKMGSTVVEAVNGASDMSLVMTADFGDSVPDLLKAHRPDVVIDFTHPDSVQQNVRYALEAGCHVVVGTTGGITDNNRPEFDALAASRGLGIALCPNFAIGVIMMMKAAELVAKQLDRVEIIELHHDKKADAPSGTAIKTATMIAESNPNINATPLVEKEIIPGARGGAFERIPLHSVRLPGYIASQEVLFGGLGERVSIRHDTLSREAFMPGVLLAVRRIRDCKGLVYGLENFLS